MKKINVIDKFSNLNILSDLNLGYEDVQGSYKGHLAPCVVFEDETKEVYFVAYSKKEFIENVEKVPPTLEELKAKALSELSKRLPRKVIGAKKQLIKKPWLTDIELEAQLDLYEKKYEDAKLGLDVFAAQSAKNGVSQEVFRAIVIQKGDALKQGEKNINDLIEMIRQVIEDKIVLIGTQSDHNGIMEKLSLIDEFTVVTPLQEIMKVLNA